MVVVASVESIEKAGESQEVQDCIFAERNSVQIACSVLSAHGKGERKR